MKTLKIKTLFFALSIAATTLISCNKDDDNGLAPIIVEGTTVTVTNTFEGGAGGPASTGGAEVPIEQFFTFAKPETLTAKASVAEAVEFPAYLLGLYDIDVDTNSIDFKMFAKTGDATYGNFFRTIEAGSFDRYYLTFDKAHNVKGFTSSNPSVKLRIDSANVLVVEIGQGFVFQPGAAFTITLN